jgi:DNA end-binding protein Ku
VSDIQRAYQYAPNQYVPIEPEELEKIRPAKDKALVLERFIPAHQVDPVLYSGRTLYLLPDGMAPGHPYSVVAEALREGSKWAIGRVVLSGSRRLVVVRPTGKLLAMDLLHYPAQVRAAAAYETDLPGATPTSEEVHLARTLIDSAAPLNWADYRDTTTEELTALIQAKMAGQPLTAPAEEPVAVLQLLDALKQSVAAAEQKLPAVKEKPRKPKAPRRAG